MQQPASCLEYKRTLHGLPPGRYSVSFEVSVGPETCKGRLHFRARGSGLWRPRPDPRVEDFKDDEDEDGNGNEENDNGNDEDGNDNDDDDDEDNDDDHRDDEATRPDSDFNRYFEVEEQEKIAGKGWCEVQLRSIFVARACDVDVTVACTCLHSRSDSTLKHKYGFGRVKVRPIVLGMLEPGDPEREMPYYRDFERTDGEQPGPARNLDWTIAKTDCPAEADPDLLRVLEAAQRDKLGFVGGGGGP
eukprot:tig00000093_g3571.t1